MPETKISTVSAAGLKRFVKHLCRISKKYEEKELARRDLKRQISKIKTTSLAKKTKRYVLERDLKVLEDKINRVLDKELELLMLGKQDSILIMKLHDRIKKLESHFNTAKQKLDFFSSEKFDVKRPIETDTLTTDLRIKELETKYEKLKREGKLSRYDLSRVEEKINALKKRLISNI